VQTGPASIMKLLTKSLRHSVELWMPISFFAAFMVGLNLFDLDEALEDKNNIVKKKKKKINSLILYLNISRRQCFANSGLFNTDKELCIH
jgi:hypothetical protein